MVHIKKISFKKKWASMCLFLVMSIHSMCTRSSIHILTHVPKYVFTRVFLATVFLTVKDSKSLKYPSVRD